MSGQLKLSKLFYVNPTLLPKPHFTPPYTPHYDNIYLRLKNDIFTNGFDPKHPIIMSVGLTAPLHTPLPNDSYFTPLLYQSYIKEKRRRNIEKVVYGVELPHTLNKVLSEFPRFPSATSIKALRVLMLSTITDGNHRLAIALELNLDYVPVRFEYMICN